jgi:hypothetical protein
MYLLKVNLVGFERESFVQWMVPAGQHSQKMILLSTVESKVPCERSDWLTCRKPGPTCRHAKSLNGLAGSNNRVTVED